MVKRSLPIERKEDWLDALLIDRFGNCKNHREKFNEKNVFCLDCGISFCRYDKESHYLHRKVQIYRYCYVDVAKYSDLLKYFDCSYIQVHFRYCLIHFINIFWNQLCFLMNCYIMSFIDLICSNDHLLSVSIQFLNCNLMDSLCYIMVDLFCSYEW